MSWHDAEFAWGEPRVQVAELNVPEPEVAKVTVPLGACAVPPSVSVTVAVQVEAWLTTPPAPQSTVVWVVRSTLSEKPGLELPAWVVVPG